MAAAAPAVAALAAGEASKQAAGVLRTVLNALDRDVLTFHWERPSDSQGNPRLDRNLVLKSVDLRITTGLILGTAALALLWEVGNWFAQAFNKSGSQIPSVAQIILTPTPILLYDLLTGKPILDPTTGQQKAVSAPATFGSSLNTMLRDLTVGGPGQAALILRNLVATVAPKG